MHALSQLRGGLKGLNPSSRPFAPLLEARSQRIVWKYARERSLKKHIRVRIRSVRVSANLLGCEELVEIRQMTSVEIPKILNAQEIQRSPLTKNLAYKAGPSSWISMVK